MQVSTKEEQQAELLQDYYNDKITWESFLERIRELELEYNK